MIDSSPNDAYALNNRGVVNAQKGDFELALRDFNRAIQVGFGNYRMLLSVVYANRGSAYFITGDYTRAIADYSKTLELTPNFKNRYIRLNRGIAFLHKQQFADARKDFKKLCDLEFNSGDPCYVLKILPSQ